MSGFTVGDVWCSPTGLLYRIIHIQPSDGRFPSMISMRRGSDGTGRLFVKQGESRAGWSRVVFNVIQPSADPLESIRKAIERARAALADNRHSQALGGRGITADRHRAVDDELMAALESVDALLEKRRSGAYEE